MMKTGELAVAVLAGGDSTRFGTDKALVMFQGKPLITRMTGLASLLSRRVLVVLAEEEQRAAVTDLVGAAQIVVDPDDTPACALRGAVTAFEHAEAEYTLLLPVDTPLVSLEMMRALASLVDGHGAVIPSWPNGFVEPLHGVYKTERAYARGLEATDLGKLRMQDLLDALTNVLYVTTGVLKQFDPDLDSFKNMNTPEDLRQIEAISKVKKPI
jgi:molybdopterin-guanine dinucleotide biosynthesis protein A